MNFKKTLLLTTTLMALMACSSTDKKATDLPTEDIPADQEIKMDDLESQLKTDEERADSMKKALGIE
ncbi:MAG: hypothetical protein ACI9UJ_001475 [bacterium]|jgi:hypothetical protein